MTEFEAQVLGDLHVLKSQMEQIMGIGQPGRLHSLEVQASKNKDDIQKLKGFVAAFGAVLAVLHLAITWFSAKHG
jgi:hypothetical protein